MKNSTIAFFGPFHKICREICRVKNKRANCIVRGEGEIQIFVFSEL